MSKISLYTALHNTFGFACYRYKRSNRYALRVKKSYWDTLFLMVPQSLRVFKDFVGLLLTCLILFMVCSHANAESEYYNFDLAWDEVPQFGKNVGQLTSSALSKGKIGVKDGLLVYESGLPARFWGVGIRITNQFPPSDRELTKKLINRLKGFGVNQLRIIGFDFGEPGMFSQWIDTGKFADRDIKRVCWLLAEARKNGIYYTLDINHISGKYIKDAEYYNRYFGDNKKLKYVQLFDEELIRKYQEWIAYALSEKHAGCDSSFAEDEHLIYLNAVNEDSIFQAFNRNFKELAPRAKQYLDRKFTSFLLTKYQTIDEVRKSWRAGKRGLDDGFVVDLPGKAELNDKDRRAAVVDVMEFLYQTDAIFALKVREAIQKTGYKGLFTFTNNWYGYGPLKVTDETSDFVEIHGYFDHPKRPAKFGNMLFVLSNESYLDAAIANGDVFKSGKPHNVIPLYRLFASELSGKPLVVSEWNHGSFSDYAYEGPILMTSYGSLHGVSAVTLHTYLNRNDSLESTISSSGLNVAGNPVMLALMPSLSVAFVNQYIEKDNTAALFHEAETMEDYWVRTFQIGDQVTHMSGDADLSAGFVRKTGKTLTEAVGAEAPTTNRKNTAHLPWISSTGQIVWGEFGGAGVISVNAEKFQSITGLSDSGTYSLDVMTAQMSDRAALTVVSLDDEPLIDSSVMLFTAVGNFQNTAMKYSDTSLFSRKTYRVIYDSGESPPRLKKLHGIIRIKTSQKGAIKVSALMANGTEQRVNARCANHMDRYTVWEFSLDDVDTPWFLLNFDNSVVDCSQDID